MTNQIWTNGLFETNSWAEFDGDNKLSGDVIISLEDWQSGAWTDHEGRLALSVVSSDDIDVVASVLEYFDMVVVNFASFANGTAFSIARLIRDKFGFKHEIRARGAYIIDQMPMLERCGVTSFEVSSDAVKAGLDRGLWPDMPRYYQHALDADRIKHVDTKRPWLSVVKGDVAAEQRSAA
ncbi:MAG: DUF934 domain-containing protein [Hyphomicrobiales bacterium]